MPDQGRWATLRRLETSFSQGAEWKMLISKYIGTIPVSGDASCAAEHSKSSEPPPRTPVNSAMIAKVGAAARHSQFAAPKPADPRPPSNTFFMPVERRDIEMSAMVVLVVAAPPRARLVAPFGGAVEPVVHAKERIHAARISGIGVVEDAVLARERAHARPVTMVAGHVGSGHGRELGLRRLAATLVARAPAKYVAYRRLAPIVVFESPLPLLLLRERDVEVEIELAAE